MPKARSGNLEIEYEVIGDGEPLLLVQGLATQMVMWPDRFVEEFTDRGFQVIRFDNRDVGFSTRLTEAVAPPLAKTLINGFSGRRVVAPYDLYDMAGDAVAVLDQLGIDRAHVFGVSMGGMIAQCVAIMYPERALSVTSMMATTGARWAAVPSPRALRALLRRPPDDREAAANQLVDFFRQVRGSRFHFDEEIVRDLGMRAHDRGLCARGALRHLAAIAATGDRTPMLRDVQTPFLVIHGTEDPLVPVWGGMATRRAIPGSRLKLIGGLGHELPPGSWPIVTKAVRRHADGCIGYGREFGLSA